MTSVWIKANKSYHGSCASLEWDLEQKGLEDRCYSDVGKYYLPPRFQVWNWNKVPVLQLFYQTNYFQNYFFTTFSQCPTENKHSQKERVSAGEKQLIKQKKIRKYVEK